MSASIFGNEKLAEIVLLLEAEDGALLAAELSRRTGFTHSLVMDVLVRLTALDLGGPRRISPVDRSTYAARTPDCPRVQVEIAAPERRRPAPLTNRPWPVTPLLIGHSPPSFLIELSRHRRPLF
jgi:hypothetical protein